MKTLPTLAMEKLVKEAGAKRVSDSAKQELKELLVEKAMEVSKKAVVFASHAGRQTIKKEDIKLSIS